MRILAPVLFGLAALACGCAKIEIVDVATHPNTDGIRYYRPDLYMLVTSQVDKDGNPTGGKDIKFIPLPNMNQQYAIRQVTGIGTTEMKPILTDGWNLTSFDATQDTKVPETITAVSSLITAAAGAAKPGFLDLKPAISLKDGLYRLTYNADGQVNGLASVNLNVQ